MPVTVRLWTLPFFAPLSSFIARSLFSDFPWKPPLASASSAFWAVLTSGAVIVTVFFFWSHFPCTPSTSLRIVPTVFTQLPQQRWTFVNSTVVSAMIPPVQASEPARLANTSHRENCIYLPLIDATWANACPEAAEDSPPYSNIHRRAASSSRVGFHCHSPLLDVTWSA